MHVAAALNWLRGCDSVILMPCRSCESKTADDFAGLIMVRHIVGAMNFLGYETSGGISHSWVEFL